MTSRPHLMHCSAVVLTALVSPQVILGLGANRHFLRLQLRCTYLVIGKMNYGKLLTARILLEVASVLLLSTRGQRLTRLSSINKR
jgi:hypothetical protein